MAQDIYPCEVCDRLRSYGERVRIARVRRRWSQAELAERMGVERRTVSRLETGSPGVGTGALLAALWVLGLWNTTRDVADPAADPVGIFLEKQRRPKQARRRQEKELDF
jgi:transcriptional regulator with XRE-family HTH domain